MRTTMGWMVMLALAAGCGDGGGDGGDPGAGGSGGSGTGSAGGGGETGQGGAGTTSTSSADTSTTGGGDGGGGEAGGGGTGVVCQAPAGLAELPRLVTFPADTAVRDLALHEGVLAYSTSDGNGSMGRVARVRADDGAEVPPALFLGEHWTWRMAYGDDGTLIASGNCLGASDAHPTGSLFVELFDEAGDVVPLDTCDEAWMGHFAVTDDAIFATDHDTLRRFPRAGGAPEVVFEHPEGGLAWVALDGDHAYLTRPGWSGGGADAPGELWRVALDGTSAEVIHRIDPPPAPGDEVVEVGPFQAFVHEGFVYFHGVAGGILARIPVEGGEVEILADVHAPTRIARAGDRMVFLSGDLQGGECGSIVGSIPLDGGPIVEHGWLPGFHDELVARDGAAWVGGSDLDLVAGIHRVVMP